jgi:predicted secreted hydrolase
VKRRAFVVGGVAALACGRAAADAEYARVVPRPLAFPRDHGSHPGFRTEWWYITGWTRDREGIERGVQVTFFRTRPGVAENLRSAFAPVQVLFAHAALADPALRRLRHDQRAARAGLGLADAAEGTTDVTLDDWSLVLEGDVYRARVAARDFALDLAFRANAAPLLQGDEGVSRKGPLPQQASYYYSQPHLALSGSIGIEGRTYAVEGTAWLDHEWSSDYLAENARGWDWTGIDLDDGGALMAFRIRDARGSRFWAAATLQRRDGTAQRFGVLDVVFQPLQRWRSPRTGIEYPVAMRVRAGDFEVTLEPLFEDQELDARASVGTVYWEGAVRATAGAQSAGSGYLELTGYGEPLRL